MRDYSSILVVIRSLCLLITLLLAWCLVGVRSSAFMKTVFPNYQWILMRAVEVFSRTRLMPASNRDDPMCRRHSTAPHH